MELYAGDTWIPPEYLTALKTTESFSRAGSMQLSCIGGVEALTSEKQIITMQDGGETVFRGRVLTAVRKTVGEMQLVCEGDLAFFNDSMTKGNARTGTPAALMQSLLADHNANVAEWQRLSAGTFSGLTNQITIKGDIDDEVPIMELVGQIAEQVDLYLNPPLMLYTSNAAVNLAGTRWNQQGIQFGENLISFKRESRYYETVTRIYAYGEDSEGNRITLDSLLGVPYVESETAIARFGIISKCMNFDAETAEELAAKARSRLREYNTETITIEALDLHWKNNAVPRFRPGFVTIDSMPDQFHDTLLLREVTQDWLNPGKNQIKISANQIAV